MTCAFIGMTFLVKKQFQALSMDNKYSVNLTENDVFIVIDETLLFDKRTLKCVILTGQGVCQIYRVKSDVPHNVWSPYVNLLYGD
jgi:energy-converting hydrogenase Eha subunit H